MSYVARTVSRYPEIDLLRCAAIAMMIVYHAAFDLSQFYGWDIDPFSGYWKLLARVTATLFLLLVGVSATLMRASMRRRDESNTAIWLRFVRRGLGVLACGMIVTLVTLVADPDTYVRFGILHLIGVSLMLLPLFMRFGGWNIVLAIPVVWAQSLISGPYQTSGFWLPFGVYGYGFQTVDYFPLAPWFGVVLLGVGIGHLLYSKPTPLSQPSSRLRHFLDRLGASAIGTVLTAPGRHSLLLYMGHQPVILLLLSLILGKPL